MDMFQAVRGGAARLQFYVEFRAFHGECLHVFGGFVSEFAGGFVPCAG